MKTLMITTFAAALCVALLACVPPAAPGAQPPANANPDGDYAGGDEDYAGGDEDYAGDESYGGEEYADDDGAAQGDHDTNMKIIDGWPGGDSCGSTSCSSDADCSSSGCGSCNSGGSCDPA